MSYETLSNAPITEAVLDIWAQLPADAGTETLETFHDKVKDHYKSIDTQYQVSGKFDLSAPGSTQGTTEIHGYLFRSADKADVVQTRRDGFTINRLKPYKDWDKFSTEARRLWELYVQHAKPQRVTKIGLRYINTIEIPLPSQDLGKYVRTYPEISSDLPQSLAGLLMRLVFPLDAETTGVLMQAIAQGPKKSKVSVPIVLDIEVSRACEFGGRDEALWEAFGKLRDFKNDLFFNSITPETRERFK